MQVANDDAASGFTFSAFSVFSFQSQVQDGPDGIALVDDSNNVIEFIAYGKSFTANNGPAAGLTATLMGVEEPANGNPANSLQLGGVGTKASDFVWQPSQLATPGSINTGQTIICT